MRFAISLLTVLAIASAIGTVLQQNQAYSSYVIEFGAFWFDVFRLLGLFDVYHSWWFLLILVFLVLSTGLCLYRQVPLMLREIRTFREHANESSLRSFAHRSEFPAPANAGETITRYLTGQGFRFKVAPSPSGDTLIAAKAGSYTRLGYIFTHAAIVIICLGGLIDGNVPLKIQETLGWKKIEKRDLPQDQVPAISRLSTANLSFRGSITIPENGDADVVFLNVADGYLVQELPFLIKLKKFRIEHYPTGQPKTFESDLIITDPDTKKSFETTIAVNHPLIYKGIAIYQASFGDGGSKLKLQGWNLYSPSSKSFPFDGVVNQTAQMSNGALAYSVEFGDFRKFNIQDAGEAEPNQEKPGFLQGMGKVMEEGAAGSTKKNLRNVGPSYQYKLRDAQGQAHEYHNYMQAIAIDGRSYWISGMRASPAEPFRYIRFPADENGTLEGYMRLRATLFDKSLHPEIARRFTDGALPDKSNPALRAKLHDSAMKILELFSNRGFDALGKFIEETLPEAEREKAADTYIKVLERALFEANQLSRSRAGLKPAEVSSDSLQFVRDSLNALNDSFFFGAPVYLQLTDFTEVTATGLQIARSPGKNIVYAGSFLLTLGIFFMFYIRERRIWLLVKPSAGTTLFAMSCNRKTIDFDKEFERHQRNLAELLSKG
ncbi:MAG: cytochrome c biogenesis protein ResB [Sulfuricella sp.]|nr:cytochrome c biogenesis protein ResB [Sulfuricella sp.]